MDIKVHKNKEIASKFAANKAKEILVDSINKRGKAVFVLATGASQLDFLSNLVKYDDIDWDKTTMYHLDEYIGISKNNKASFRKYINDNFLSKINDINEYYFIKGESNPQEECERLNKIINKEKIIDVSFLGIGENGHLAFNEPYTDLNDKTPFKIVELDEISRRQQVKEGWFKTIDEVPQKAITITVNQILKSKKIICTVPGKRKAEAVYNCFKNNEIISEYPASALKCHSNVFVFLDESSAKLLFN